MRCKNDARQNVQANRQRVSRPPKVKEKIEEEEEEVSGAKTIWKKMQNIRL